MLHWEASNTARIASMLLRGETNKAWKWYHQGQSSPDVSKKAMYLIASLYAITMHIECRLIRLQLDFRPLSIQ